MSIRDYSRESGGQRAGRDRKRHRQKCREAIRKGLARLVADLVGTLHVAREQGLDIRALQPAHSLDRLYPSFNRDRAALHARVNAELEGMLADGYIAGAYRRILDLDVADVLGEDIARKSKTQQ